MACPININCFGQLQIIDPGILLFNLSVLELKYLLHNRITLDKFKIEPITHSLEWVFIKNE